jgi:hypothetical protein
LPTSFSLVYERLNPSNTPCNLARPSRVLHCRVCFDQRSSPGVNNANVSKTTSGLYPDRTSLGQHPRWPARGINEHLGFTSGPHHRGCGDFSGQLKPFFPSINMVPNTPVFAGFRPLRQSFVVFAFRSHHGAAEIPQIPSITVLIAVKCSDYI